MSARGENLPTAAAAVDVVHDKEVSADASTSSESITTKIVTVSAATTQRIGLDRDGRSWIEVSELKEELKEYYLRNFDTVYAMRPDDKSVLVAFEKDVRAHRRYASFGATPAIGEVELATSNYMFGSLAEGGAAPTAIPEVLDPLLEFANKVCKPADEPDYNQVVLNWYADGGDYCPFHQDWISPGADASNVRVSVISFGATRTFRVKPVGEYVDASLHSRVDIIATHGSVITMCGATQAHFRHGIPKDKPRVEDGRRISVSFRHF